MVELDSMYLYAYKNVHSTVKVVKIKGFMGNSPHSRLKKEKIDEKRGQKSIIKPGIQVS
jgi:hypothetical protein